MNKSKVKEKSIINLKEHFYLVFFNIKTDTTHY